MTAPAAMVDTTVGGLRWRLPEAERDQLLDANGLRLPEWLRAGQARVIKQAPHRTIYHVTLPGLSFFLKHYPLNDLRAWLRQLVRPSKARGEFDNAVSLAARDIPTFQPLALGERIAAFGAGESYLLTHTLEAAVPLDLFLQRDLPTLPMHRRTVQRQRLAAALGDLLARMHEAGVLHHDLHTANLLVRWDAQDRPELFLIDLHCLRLSKCLDWQTSRDNLILLNRWFTLRSSRADRQRFWTHYIAGRASNIVKDWLAGLDLEMPLHNTRRAAHDLERRTLTSNLSFWKARDRRCLVRNRHYAPVRAAAASGFAVADLDKALRDTLAGDPDGPFRQAGVILHKDSRTSTVAEFEATIDGQTRRVIYKRFRVKKWTEPWVSLARRSAALRSWVYGHGFRERCLPTARPLLVLHRRRAGLHHEGYLLAEKIENAAELQQFLKELQALPWRERQAILRCRIDQAARLIRDLHRCRFAHRDLKAANLLVVRDPAPAVEQSRYGPFHFIDLVGVELRGKLRRRHKVQNLARLNASFIHDAALSRTDRLRFLRIYLTWGLSGRVGWKRWWKAIEAATLVKMAKNQRTGRPLA